LRQLIQRGLETDIGPFSEALRVDGDDRTLRGKIAACYARTGDYDFFQLVLGEDFGLRHGTEREDRGQEQRGLTADTERAHESPLP
jgi:hypothetical protein